MPVTTDQVIAALEAQAENALLVQSKTWFFSLIPQLASKWLGASIGGAIATALGGPFGTALWFVLSPLIDKYVVEVVIKKLDIAGFWTVKTVVNRGDAENYVQARRMVDAANESGDKDAIAKAEAAEEAAFFRLGLLSA